MSDPNNQSENPLQELFIPGLRKVVELEAAHYRANDQRKAAGQPFEGKAEVEPLRNELMDLAEKLRPFMISILGDPGQLRSQAQLEAMPSPLTLVKELPAEFLWLAITKYLERVRDEIFRAEAPPRQPGEVGGVAGLLKGAGLAGLLSALQSGDADISLKVVDGRTIAEKGMQAALDEAPNLFGDLPRAEDGEEGVDGEEREGGDDGLPGDFPRE